MPFNLIDLYCGFGAFSKGFSSVGFNVILGIDNNSDVESTFRANHPNASFLCEDMLNLDVSTTNEGITIICRREKNGNLTVIWSGKVDVVIGSPPCKYISDGRKSCKKQLDFEITKQLVEAYMRFISSIKPKFWVMEDVANVVDLLDERWPVVTILDARNFGVPAKRIRCFAGNYFVPEPTHSKKRIKTLFGIREQWVTAGKALGIKDNPLWVIDRYPKKNKSYSPVYNGAIRPARTITTRPHLFVKGGNEKPTAPFEAIRKMSPQEMAILQSFGDDFKLCGKDEKTNELGVGNAVPVKLAEAIASKIRGKIFI